MMPRFQSKMNLLVVSGVAPSSFPQDVGISQNSVIVFVVGGILGLMAILTITIGLAFYFKKQGRSRERSK